MAERVYFTVHSFFSLGMFSLLEIISFPLFCFLYLLVNVEIKLFFGWFTMRIKDLLLCELHIEKRVVGYLPWRGVIGRAPNSRVVINRIMHAIILSFLWNIFTCGFNTRVFATNRKVERKYANYRLVWYSVVVQWVTAMRRFFVSKVNPFLCQ